MSSRLSDWYRVKTIIEFALLEGGAFVCLVAYIMVAQWWLLAVAGFLLFVMAVTFPTHGRFESWAREQWQLAEMEDQPSQPD